MTFDGGYAEMMIVDVNALTVIPADVSSAEAAPLLDAGLTTFNALRNAQGFAGDHVGGLWESAVSATWQSSTLTDGLSHDSYRAIALKKNPSRSQLGAHHYIDSEAGDPAEALRQLGGAAVILATAASGQAMTALIGGLAVRGRMVVVGVPPEAITIAPVSWSSDIA